MPISYLSYALRKRGYGYFNLNFCREEQLQTTSFLRIRQKGNRLLFFLRQFSRDTYTFFWHCRSTQSFWNNVSQWTSENLDLTNLNIAPFSLALCLGLIENISNLLLHRFLLIARHYMYSCKLRNTFPLVQVYTQLVIRSMEIEKQIVFDNNNLASFRKKWATFAQCPSEII